MASATLSAAPLPRFVAGSVWNRDISAAPLDPNSATMISTLQGLGGWGNGNAFQIDFGIVVLHATDSDPTQPVVAWPSAAGYYSPDCEAPGLAFPLPSGGAIEGSPGYSCNHASDDCHLLVVRGRSLFEAYAATVTSAGVEARCALRWDLDKIYPPEGRGEHCTSADGAGFPIAALLFNADEVAAAIPANGDLGHAIRFVLPNDRIAASRYVHPSTHGTTTVGPLASVPYGVRMRLLASFDMSAYNAAAKVILRTMQRFGIVLSDGGNIALTAEDDRFNTHTWDSLGIDSHTFNPGTGSPPVQVTDFEVVDTGPQRDVTFNCTRVADDFVFIDHMEF
ncbi:MAG: hypothetical protein ABI451_12160 [Dokdonella sp.]